MKNWLIDNPRFSILLIWFPRVFLDSEIRQILLLGYPLRNIPAIYASTFMFTQIFSLDF